MPAASVPLSLEVAQREGLPANRVSALMTLARQCPELDHISNTRLSRLVNAFVTELHDHDLVSWVITYSDPTGEKAVNKVMREQAAA